MLRRVTRVQRYHWILGGAILLVALFVLASPPVPKDLNYRYQLDLGLRSYPLVTQTAGLVEWSTERVREVYRWNLTAETVARSWPPAKAGTAGAALPATAFIILGILAMVLVWFVPAKRWVGAGLIVFVIAGSHLGAHPAAYTELMSAPSTLVPNAAATLVIKAEPGHTMGVERETAYGLKDMADRYFEHYVTFTKHRMASAGKLFAGPKRIWFGVTGLVYVLPFAVALAGLAALTVLVQTLTWLLFMLAPFGIVLALIDGRAGLKVRQHVLVPMLTSLALLAVLGLILPLVLFLATIVHALENEIGLLLIGSMFPLIVVVVVALLIRRSRQGGNDAIAQHEDGATWTDADPDGRELPARPRRGLRAVVPHARRPRE